MAEHQGSAVDSAGERAIEPGDETLDLLPTGPDGYERLLDLIDGAQNDLRLLFYTFLADEAGKEVLDRLLKAANRGVEVRLIVDDFGSIETDDDFFRPLKDVGALFCEFQPNMLQRYLLRNHQKIAIADSRRGIVGSFNIADSHLVDDSEKGWRDIGVFLEGPAITRLADYYDALFEWVCSSRQHISRLKDILEEANETEGPVRWVIGGPSRGYNAYVRQVRQELRTASCIDMIMAYFAPSPRILGGVRRVAREGNLRMITAAKTDVKLSRAAARHTYRKLLRAGAEIYEYQPKPLHSKLIVADGAVYIGSGNFDVRSLYVNLEIMLRVERDDFRKTVGELFENELKDCKRIDMETLKAKAKPWTRAFWRVAYWLMTAVDRFLSRRLAQ